MDRFALRRLATYVLLVVFPALSVAADSRAAMLYTNGSAWVNGAHVPRPSSAIFSGDLLQTRSDSLANINEAGSILTVLPDSLVKFEIASLTIEHGGVTVATSQRVTASAGVVKVAPTSNSWTEFSVTDVDGTVRVLAKKGDVTVTDGSTTTTLAQGQETTLDESSDTDTGKKNRRKSGGRGVGAAPAAGGGALNSTYAIVIGIAAAGGVGAWIISKDDDPVSPAKP
jgi:hypothetical protein